MNKKTPVVVAIFVVTIIVLFVYTIRDHNNQSWKFFTDKHRRQPVSVENVSHISQWMTFDYINEVFNLPPDFLKEKLNIHDTKYPFITISQYSEKTNTDVRVVIKNIQDSVTLAIKMKNVKQ